jgi:hypothetical protein
LLLSTEFSSALLRIVKYVSITVESMELIPILLPTGEKQVLCRSVDVGVPYEPPTIPTKEGNLAYIDDESVRELCERHINDLESRGVEIKPNKGYKFSLFYQGRRFMSLKCKKKFLSIRLYMDGGQSKNYKIVTNEDWSELINPYVELVIES